jgi:hypothetical protein
VWCSAGVGTWSTLNDVSKVSKYNRFNIYANDFQTYHSSTVSD